jgi:hypothetical protein
MWFFNLYPPKRADSYQLASARATEEEGGYFFMKLSASAKLT